MAGSEELQGITLNVYLYVAKKGKPVGPRDVTKGVNLSSPSVAYRHLQKLEDEGYLAKNEYGEYTVKRKATLKGLVWIGHSLIPKMWLYASIFLIILIVEITIWIIHLPFESRSNEFMVFFLLLTLITGAAFTVFAVEGALESRRKLGSSASE
jgi:DNA-binding transcriptional ArsR family regulator